MAPMLDHVAGSTQPIRLHLPRRQTASWEEHQVVVVGGGPVGLFTALSLARKGVEVVVLDDQPELCRIPWALTLLPVVLDEFDKVGILEDVVAAGEKNHEGLCFRTAAYTGDVVLAWMRDNQRVERMSSEDSHRTNDASIQISRTDLVSIILSHASKLPNFSIRFDHRVTGVQERSFEEGSVDLVVSTSESERYFRSSFVVGTDGACSSVRRALCIPFEGFTWTDFRFVTITLFHDFPYPPVNHVIDVKDWADISLVGKRENKLWQIFTGFPASSSDKDIESQLPKKLEKLIPGSRPLDYKIETVSPYLQHERVAATYRRGRVVLAGDAAHVNNPLAGLGLTTGILDVPSLTNALVSAVNVRDEYWEDVLEAYARKRRDAFLKFTQPEAIAGKIRIHSMEPEVSKMRDVFFHMLNNDPGFQKLLSVQMANALHV